jgi:hypothetical protein
MNIIKTHPVNKDKAAEILGLKVYDVALPQPWLDDAALTLRLSASARCGRIPPDSLYDRILSGTVWCYDRCKIFGEPFALTEQAHELICILAELKHQPIPQQDKVLSIQGV